MSKFSTRKIKQYEFYPYGWHGEWKNIFETKKGIWMQAKAGRVLFRLMNRNKIRQVLEWARHPENFKRFNRIS